MKRPFSEHTFGLLSKGGERKQASQEAQHKDPEFAQVTVITPVLFLLKQVKMFAVKKAY